jgi:hypothetical protein
VCNTQAMHVIQKQKSVLHTSHVFFMKGVSIFSFYTYSAQGIRHKASMASNCEHIEPICRLPIDCLENSHAA